MPLPRSIGHWILEGREIKIRPSHSRPGKGENNNLQTRWATHGKRLKGLKVAGSVERQTGGEKPFATRIAIFFWRR